MLLSCFYSDTGSFELTDVGMEKFFTVEWKNLRKLDVGNLHHHFRKQSVN